MKSSTKTVLTAIFGFLSLITVAASIANYLVGETLTSIILFIAAVSCFLITLECLKIKIINKEPML